MRKRLTLRLDSYAVAVRLPLDADVVAALKARYGWRWKMAANAILRDWPTARRAKHRWHAMTKRTKIASTDEAWEDGTLGASAEHATAAPDAMQAAINASLAG